MNFSKTKHKQQSIRIIDAKKSLYFTVIAILFSVISVNAQVTSEPPTPPNAPKVKSSSGTSYSISIDNDDDETHNSSVSISISDDSYKFRASYHDSKDEGVKNILLKSLGRKNLKVKGNTYLWNDGNDAFECKLMDERLRIYVNFDEVSKGFLDKINTLGNDLKYYISGSSKEKEEAKKVERAKRDMERAQRDLERAQRDLERSQRAAERAKKN